MLEKRHELGVFLLGFLFIWQAWQSFFDVKVLASQLQDFGQQESVVILDDDGLVFQASTKARTVAEFLKEQRISTEEHDLVYPQENAMLSGMMRIIIQRAKKITIKAGGKIEKYYTLQNTVEKAIWENKSIILGEDDVTLPAKNMPLKNDTTIVVTHVLIKEETKNVDIPFKTVTNEDGSLGWRIKKITQKGELGVKEVKYKVVYNDGKEISRKILESNVSKDPIDEIVTQGTLVKVGKVHTGAASWYAYTGTLSAANPWLPMGSYVRVTNKDNGKSVIVKINDRGPFGNGRIIDLDKVAFAQIAPLGQGTANIKMEVITN